MVFSCLQRFTARGFSALRRGLLRCARSIRSRPRLAAWIYREDELKPHSTDAAYRAFNLSYFAHFGEQERMLADRPRMDFYHAAVTRFVRPGDRVIDLGTGTGILAAFAARCGAGKVYAIDHSDILKHARSLARHNRIENVEFIPIHSREFSTREPVDIILHEQMGDFLFDEAMVPNVLDLRDRLLKPGGRIVPNRFQLFCEPIKVRDERHVPFIWELNVHGYDYSSLGDSRPRDLQYYQLNRSDLGVVEHFLGTPAPALTIDLETLRETDLPHEIVLQRLVVNAGRLDGFAVFFRANAASDIALSSSPLDPGRAPHWGFRILRAEADEFEAGDVVELTLNVGNWAVPASWSWSHCRLTPPANPPA